MRSPRFGIRTLMIAVAASGIVSWFLARNGQVSLRDVVIGTVGTAAVIAVVALFCVWGWVAFQMLRPPD